MDFSRARRNPYVTEAHRRFPKPRRDSPPGQADAYQHCLASCLLAQNYGSGVSAALGWANEYRAEENGYQNPADEMMDTFNNACGRSFATEDVDCRLACEGALGTGLLERLDISNYPPVL